MRVLGIDFTSRPRRRKPITCLECTLVEDELQAGELKEWCSFEEFESALQAPGPWIAGIDFPFGFPRKFIENMGWPETWRAYVEHAKSLGREGFRTALDEYRSPRPPGDKEHLRVTDIRAGSISPQKLYGVPVALMFFEGAPRLRGSGVTIPLLQEGDPERIVVEAYPGVLARHLIGRHGYKQDTKRKQTKEQYEARVRLMKEILGDKFHQHYGVSVCAPKELADDPAGDCLDALLCAIQAAWAWSMRDKHFGAPTDTDALEGWIADPGVAR